jgi:hypothetical protein
MTIKIEVECDALDCWHTTAIEDSGCGAVAANGFHEDPNCGWQHYCSSCWPKVEVEIEKELDK